MHRRGMVGPWGGGLSPFLYAVPGVVADVVEVEVVQVVGAVAPSEHVDAVVVEVRGVHVAGNHGLALRQDLFPRYGVQVQHVDFSSRGVH